MKELLKYRDNKKLINILVTLVGSTLYSLGIKWFIIPAKLKTGGFTGIAQIIYGIIYNTFGSFLSYDLGVGIIWFIINIPVFYLGFQSLGKRFTFLSFLAVLNGMITLAILPVPEILSEQGLHNDLMLSALLGGTITGIGVGITLKVGASTGGMDIISQYLSFKKDRPFGHYSFILN
ncbi:MAG: YitT family protein, partial [Bacilli bacterium]|nr:YitT family protein [Bacilli bacterium]